MINALLPAHHTNRRLASDGNGTVSCRRTNTCGVNFGFKKCALAAK
ncbi:hypothetical protein [Phormidium sp. FACHB-1136]|nr:hypothetical protein [Phormidium sp. FACHB-1136]MBD2426364.1 hypothetical protein [Phormidium sp. FACHB-1136]